MNRRTITLTGLEVPNIVASYRIGDYPRAGLRRYPWEITGTQALLLNAYDLLANRRTKTAARQAKQYPGKIRKFVEFDGPIMLDSGAFNFLRYQDMPIKPIDVLKTGKEMGVDVVVVLDHPFPPDATADEIRSRLEVTRANTKAMFNALTSLDGATPSTLTLMPVLHGHDRETLEQSLEDIVSVTGREPDIVGIGSLAPLARNGDTAKATRVILHARRLLPNARIHVFSMGSALLMLFAFYCGADTVDSQTWVMSAAFKEVQLPGFHLTRLSRLYKEATMNATKYERNRRAFAEHLVQLIRDEGFSVKDWDTGASWPITNEFEALAYLDYLEDGVGVNHIHRRACHNLRVFNFEAARVRQAIQSRALEDFIRGRMTSTVYRRAFERAVELKSAES